MTVSVSTIGSKKVPSHARRLPPVTTLAPFLTAFAQSGIDLLDRSMSINGPITEPPGIGEKVVRPPGHAHVSVVNFFMVRPAFPSAIERRTAPRSMWWCDRTARS